MHRKDILLRSEHAAQWYTDVTSACGWKASQTLTHLALDVGGELCMCQCSCADEFYMHMLWSCVRRDYNYADNDDDYGFDDDDDTAASTNNGDDHDDYENVDDSE